MTDAAGEIYTGANLTIRAFESFEIIGRGLIVTIGIMLFAFSTILAGLRVHGGEKSSTFDPLQLWRLKFTGLSFRSSRLKGNNGTRRLYGIFRYHEWPDGNSKSLSACWYSIR